MSNPSASHVRPSFAGRTWRGFGRWRRSRPFWGGLLLLLSGIEIFLSTQLSLGGLSFQLGPTGFLSWLIPTILVACGFLAWATPQQRMFYAVVGAVTAVFSLIGVNLGGFFLGLILGIVGAGLVFGWTPLAAAPPAAATPAGDALIPAQPGPVDAEPAVDETAEQPMASDSLIPGLSDPDAPQRSPEPVGSSPDGSGGSVEAAGSGPDGSGRSAEAVGSSPDGSGRSAEVDALSTDAPVVPAQAGEAVEPPADDPAALPRRESPRFYTVIGFLLVLGMTAAFGLRTSTPAYAAPCPKPPTATVPKPPGEKPAVPVVPPAATPTPTPDAGEPEEDNPGLLGQIVDGITGLFDGDSAKDTKEGAAEPTPEPATTAKSAPAKTGGASTKPQPKPTKADCARSSVSSPAQDQPTLPLLDDEDLPPVNRTPSRLTGSKLTMWDLTIAGIATLHTTAGDIRALKFTMSRSRVDDFALRVPQGEGRPLLIKSDPLVVRGDVAFYATRFVGRFLGVKITLTPDSPIPPDGIPLTVPKIEFTDPQIQLAYVVCDTLEAPTLDESFPPAAT